MAERLTERDNIENKRYIFNSEENVICVTNKRLDNCFTIAYCWGKPIDKLAKFEDIMEKYGIESVEELDEKLKNSILPKFKISSIVYSIAFKEIEKVQVIAYLDRCIILCRNLKTRELHTIHCDYLFETEQEANNALNE